MMENFKKDDESNDFIITQIFSFRTRITGVNSVNQIKSDLKQHQFTLLETLDRVKSDRKRGDRYKLESDLLKEKKAEIDLPNFESNNTLKVKSSTQQNVKSLNENGMVSDPINYLRDKLTRAVTPQFSTKNFEHSQQREIVTPSVRNNHLQEYGKKWNLSQKLYQKTLRPRKGTKKQVEYYHYKPSLSPPLQHKYNPSVIWAAQPDFMLSKYQERMQLMSRVGKESKSPERRNRRNVNSAMSYFSPTLRVSSPSKSVQSTVKKYFQSAPTYTTMQIISTVNDQANEKSPFDDIVQTALRKSDT